MTVGVVVENRVPVEHRWLGLDRRSFGYGFAALAVIALWAWVLPWVDDRVPWDDPTRAGEAFQVTDDVTMSVPPGWGVTSGLRTSEPARSESAADAIVLVKDGVVFSVQQGPFTAAPARLLTQAERITGATNTGFRVTTEPRSTTTAGGLRGVSASFTTPKGAGSVAAFVVNGRGIEIRVAGLEGQVAALETETDAMIDSLTRVGGGS